MAKSHYRLLAGGLKTRREIPSSGKGSPVPDPTFEDITYRVLIDWGMTTKLALKAAKNKSGRAKVGPVLVEVTSSAKRAEV